jgi:hypothetical protein
LGNPPKDLKFNKLHTFFIHKSSVTEISLLRSCTQRGQRTVWRAPINVAYFGKFKKMGLIGEKFS